MCHQIIAFEIHIRFYLTIEIEKIMIDRLIVWIMFHIPIRFRWRTLVPGKNQDMLPRKHFWRS